MDESTQKMQSRQQLAGRAISHSYPTIRQEDIDAVVRCLTSRQLVAGDVTRTLEQTVAATMGYRYAAATINGSQALHLALRALPNPKSRRVGLQSYLCRTMYDATVLAGCDPQLLDLKENSFSISPEEALRANVATVIVPHMFGIRTEVEKFLEAGLMVIEDCAQRLVPEKVWSREPKPPFRILSFSATKLLTGGTGGMVLTDDEQTYNRLCSLRDAPYDLAEPAVWMPYTDIQASLALSQWGRLEDFLTKRARLAKIYLEELEDLSGCEIPAAMYAEDTYHFRFILRVDDLNHVIDHAAKSEIVFCFPVGPMALHDLFSVKGNFANTDDAMANFVSLPLYPELSEPEARRISRVLKESVTKARHGV